ncbi:MAG: DUF6050 family protein [Lachnospiraceae bacterium]|nr:DUF6050 family protein [Lachnospiraceae bacterium]
MRRLFANVILPLGLIGFWIWFSYSVCSTTGKEFNWLIFWLMVGFPFGIRKMCMVLLPRNYGLAGTVGVLAFDCIVGGIIGVVVLVIDLVKVAFTTLQIVTGR